MAPVKYSTSFVGPEWATPSAYHKWEKKKKTLYLLSVIHLYLQSDGQPYPSLIKPIPIPILLYNSSKTRNERKTQGKKHQKGLFFDRYFSYYLTMNESSNRHIPGRVCCHTKTQKRPDAVVVEGRDENSCRTARSEYIRPCPLVQPIVNVIYITAPKRGKRSSSDCEIEQTHSTKIRIWLCKCGFWVQLTSHSQLAE